MPRTVLITGCSTGIGEASALRLAAAGWRVLAGVRTEADGVRLAAQAPGRLRPVQLDVTDPAQVAAAAALVAEDTGDRGLDGLVNNAGIALGGPLEYFPLEDLRRMFEVNLFGLLALTQACLPGLRRAGGRIVNIGSISGRVTSPIIGPYAASKHALLAMNDALRMELRDQRIRVIIIEPGVVATPIWDKARALQDQARARVPAEGLARYRSFIAAVDRVIAGAARRGVPVARVADAVEHALTAPRPRVRYLIGVDARLRLALQTFLPRRWMDALIRFALRRIAAVPR